MTIDNIKLVILFSGKRKSGKDFVTQKLYEKLKDYSQIIKISKPIKSEWAKRFNLDLNELLSDGPFKEIYRKEMIEWSDIIRSEDYGYFCREALKEAKQKIIIVSDIRRKTDIKYFREIFDTKLRIVRINCSEQIRIDRGWRFQNGVDDNKSECDLDDFNEWDLKIANENNKCDEIIEKIIMEFNLLSYC